MSIKLITKAWESPAKGNDLLVLISLADNASDEGYCWPSWKSIMAKTKVSKGTLSSVLNRLEEAGYIARESRKRTNGSDASNGYYILQNKQSSKFEHHTKQGQSSEIEHHNEDGRSSEVEHGGVQKLNTLWSSEVEHLEPSINHHIEPSIKKSTTALVIHTSQIDINLLQSFIESRKSIKKPMTQKALDLFTSKAEKLYNDGYDVESMINDSIIAGYPSIYPNQKYKQSTAIQNQQPWQIEKDRQLALKNNTQAMFESGHNIFDVIGRGA